MKTGLVKHNADDEAMMVKFMFAVSICFLLCMVLME